MFTIESDANDLRHRKTQNYYNYYYLYIIRKTLKGRKQTNKYRRRTERHLPTTDESVVWPAGERR